MKNLHTASLSAVLLALGGVGMTVQAQDETMRRAMQAGQDTQAATGMGFLAEELIDQDVYGLDGEEIGEVESIVVGRNGMIDRITVETGGFLDIGDKHIAIAWDQVDLTPGVDGIMVPVDDDNVENFSLFGDRERARLSEGAFRVTELIGDEVRLKSRGEFGAQYGYVDDILFSQDGEIQSIIYRPDVYYGDDFGYYESDFYGYDDDIWYDFDPGLDYYGVDYGYDDLDEYRFDYDAYEGVL
jgi:sporulation protein YlmC with PRC-barrel domain